MSTLQAFFPEKAYPELYEDVMRYQPFPDSKTFADASPKISPEEIRTRYQEINRSHPDEVLSFVHTWFELPIQDENPNIGKKSIDEHLHSLWDHLLRKPDVTHPNCSLIPLPYSYVVPGGRFREIYYWDSYFTMLGLRISGRSEIIRYMINNFAWLLDQIGHIPNGNRSYFLSRSQPPFFSLMIELLVELEGTDVYSKYLPQLLIEYSFWMEGVEENENPCKRAVKINDRYLNRYYDDLDIPRTESYAEDVRLYDDAGKPMNLFRNLRAACESGWDFSSRWFEKQNDLASIRTTNLIPVDLNALLYMLEKTIAKAFHSIKLDEEALTFDSLAFHRADMINQFLWDEEQGVFIDMLINDSPNPPPPTLAMMYPLFAGIATQAQADSVIEYAFNHFLKPGGWVTTNDHTGQQWDAPNGWAPLQWITYMSLKNYGAVDLALEGAKRWLKLNEDVFNRIGRMMEKYNVEDLGLEAGGGEYPVQDGFGWTNGVYLALKRELLNT